MSLTKQHHEWLQLLEVSGPFLAMPIIEKTFPQGLERIDTAIKRDLRLAHQEWLDAHSNEGDLRKYHIPWIKYVLKNLLEYPNELIHEGESIPPELTIQLREHGELLKPDMVVMPPMAAPDNRVPRILISVYPNYQKLDRAVSDRKSKWNASPATRMMELLKRSSIRVGIVTNGEHWLLVYAPESDTTTFVGWYASVWMEEPLTLRSFRGLLGAYRFFGVPEADMLESLFVASTQFQHEVTTQLGGQVRRAIEQLVQALDQIDKDSGRTLLRDVSESKLYEAGVSVMMRLVFLLTAEERELFPINNPIYSENYAVLTLREQLEHLASRHGEEVLERRYDAWNRLLATFRAIFAGVRHEDFNLPAYGGNLFDPDRYPFLEGRAPETVWHETNVTPLSLNDRTVLHLLDSLQLLRGTGTKSEARKLSFRSLDVEQIGHVYESLLEHTAVRAEDLVLGLEGAQGKEPEVPVSKLQYQSQLGEDGLLNWLHEETGKSTSTLSKLLKKHDRYPVYKVQAVCDNKDSLYSSVKPFVGLVREDSQNMPVIFTPGSIYVTEGAERRSSGTHYTPRAVTEQIVKSALEPLIYNAFAEGSVASIDTLKTADQILALKICDMTCGSGAFLVQACRYLSERLIEAWSNSRANCADSSIDIDINGAAVATNGSTERKSVVPKDPDDALLFAKRLIADRCLYGVDCNPMAVEMAKLSLWLITLEKEKPFTFLDHAIKYGDSLIGIDSISQLTFFSISPSGPQPQNILATFAADDLKLASERRTELEKFLASDICDTSIKSKFHKEAEATLFRWKHIADALVSATFDESKRNSKLSSKLQTIAVEYASILSAQPTPLEQYKAFEELAKRYHFELKDMRFKFNTRAPLHWLLEFPEVFIRDNPGFDCVLGNPPFAGGKKITSLLGTDYRNFILAHVGSGKRGNADLCAYFFLRAMRILRPEGTVGMVATNTVSEGDTREVGLDQVCLDDRAEIIRAVKSTPWPGVASLEVAHVWLYKGKWNSAYILNGKSARSISTYLVESDTQLQPAYRLHENKDKSFIGSFVLGMGFVLDDADAMALIAADRRNRDVLFPFLNADDVNSRFDQSASRSVINFFDWPLCREQSGDWTSASTEQRRNWLSEGSVPSSYPEPTASDYSRCLEIVVKNVKPERTRTDDDGNFVLRSPLFKKWWIYADKRPALYSAISNLSRVLVIPLHAKYLLCSWQPTQQVFSHALAVVSSDSDAYFAILQSSIHEIWARQCGSTLETRMRYTPSDCFETFPFPSTADNLAEIGRTYHEARSKLCTDLKEGLTKLYNRFHSQQELNQSLEDFRRLHARMDQLVLAAFGWHDIVPDHAHRDTPQGSQFALSNECKAAILAKLFEENAKRQQQEIVSGLVKPSKTKRKSAGLAKGKGKNGAT